MMTIDAPDAAATPERDAPQVWVRVILLLGATMAAFLLCVGLNSESLPFARYADYSDVVTQHWPNALLMQRSIAEGRLFPDVNPFIMNGTTPFAPNPLNKAWYPFQWLVAVLPPIVHLNFLLWLHLVIAGCGMFAFVRQIGFRRSIAVTLALAWQFAPRLALATGLGHFDIIYAEAWLPVLLWIVGRRDWSILRMVGFSVVVALCFIADVRISSFIFVLAAAYVAFVVKPPRRTLALMGIGLAIAVLLAAPLWFPLVGELPKLSRQGIGVQDAGVYSMEPALLIGLFVGDQRFSGETMAFCGVALLALALVGALAFRRKVLFWLLAVFVAGLWSLGINGPWAVLANIIPALRWWRVPARAWIIVVFALTILAGYGLRALIEDGTRRQVGRWLPRFGLTFGLVGLVCAALFYGLDKGSAATAALFTLATVGLLLTVRRGGLGHVGVVRAWTILIIAEMLVFNSTLVEGVRQADWVDVYAPLVAALRADSVDHVYSPSYSFPQQAAVFYQIPIVGGIDPFQYAGYVKQVEAASGIHAQGYSVALPALDGDPATVNRDAKPDLTALAALRVSHVVAAFPLEVPGLTLLRQIEGVYLYRNERYAP